VSVRRRQVEGVVVLYPKGSFFGDQETDDLGRALMDEAAGGNTRLILNLTDCLALNSIAIGVLMRAYANYRGRDGQIRLVGMSRRLLDLFTMTRLIQLFDHHDTEEQALAAFAEGRSIVG